MIRLIPLLAVFLISCSHFKNSKSPRKPANFVLDLKQNGKSEKTDTSGKEPKKYMNVKSGRWALAEDDYKQELDEWNSLLFPLVQRLQKLGGEGELKGIYKGKYWRYYNEEPETEPKELGDCRLTIESYRGEHSKMRFFSWDIFDKRITGFDSNILYILNPERAGMNTPHFQIAEDFIHSDDFKDYEIDFESEDRIYIKAKDALNPLIDLKLSNGTPVELRFMPLKWKNSDWYEEKCIFDTWS